MYEANKKTITTIILDELNEIMHIMPSVSEIKQRTIMEKEPLERIFSFFSHLRAGGRPTWMEFFDTVKDKEGIIEIWKLN